MPQLAVHRPLDEADLYDQLRTYPVRAQARQPLRLREGRCRQLDRVESRAEIEEQLRVEAGADLSREDEVVAVVVADEQCTETGARALGIGEAADHELPRELALHLQPELRSPVLVRRASPLGDHAFPSFALCAIPRLRIVDEADALHGRFEG